MSTSTEKINNLVLEELADIINREVEFKDQILVSISCVEVAQNLNSANVFIRCFPEAQEKEAIKILYKNKGMLRQELGKKIRLRKAPYLRFYIDKEGIAGLEAREEIDRILDKIKKEDNKK